MSSRSNLRPMQMLARAALDRELTPLRKTEVMSRPSSSWIKIIREALGMTTGQLARRVGVSQPRITAIETAEAADAITIKTLRHVAEALDCKLVYTLVPNQPLEATLRSRALEIANRQLASTHHTMRLENQALDRPSLNRARERMVDELVRGDPRRLWDTP